jgi:hypothetical protein
MEKDRHKTGILLIFGDKYRLLTYVSFFTTVNNCNGKGQALEILLVNFAFVEKLCDRTYAKQTSDSLSAMQFFSSCSVQTLLSE